MLNSLPRAITNAPMDGDPVTGEDQHRLREGQTWFAERVGKGIPMEEVLAQFGLTPEDFPFSIKSFK